MTATGSYHIGDLWEFTFEITHLGAKVKPTTVTATVLTPDLQEHTVSLTEKEGVYEGQFPLAMAGPHTVSGACEGNYKGCEPQTIQCLGRFG